MYLTVPLRSAAAPFTTVTTSPTCTCGGIENCLVASDKHTREINTHAGRPCSHPYTEGMLCSNLCCGASSTAASRMLLTDTGRYPVRNVLWNPRSTSSVWGFAPLEAGRQTWQDC